MPSSDPEKVFAPFTDDQVASLNAYQASGVFHEYTCGNDRCPGEFPLTRHQALEASKNGWRCPSCSYRQDWAHAFTADWSWNVRPTVHHVHDSDGAGAHS